MSKRRSQGVRGALLGGLIGGLVGGCVGGLLGPPHVYEMEVGQWLHQVRIFFGNLDVPNIFNALVWTAYGACVVGVPCGVAAGVLGAIVAILRLPNDPVTGR